MAVSSVADGNPGRHTHRLFDMRDSSFRVGSIWELCRVGDEHFPAVFMYDCRDQSSSVRLVSLQLTFERDSRRCDDDI